MRVGMARCPNATTVSGRALIIWGASKMWTPRTLRIGKMAVKGDLSQLMSSRPSPNSARGLDAEQVRLNSGLSLV